jgi:hypothetical protein
MALSTLLYPCEIWALNRSDRRKIKTADIRFLRHTPEGMKSVILLFTASYRYVIYMTKLKIRKRNGMTTFNGWTLIE